jgi:hypothetical protein
LVILFRLVFSISSNECVEPGDDDDDDDGDDGLGSRSGSDSEN